MVEGFRLRMLRYMAQTDLAEIEHIGLRESTGVALAATYA